MDNKNYYSRWRRAKIKLGLCTSCGVVETVDGATRCVECISHRKTITPKLRAKVSELRKRVFAFLGPVCVCCGESEPAFLTIDHKNDDGFKDRKDSGQRKMLSGVLKGTRTDIQVMCWNCNCGRAHNEGICPHNRA